MGLPGVAARLLLLINREPMQQPLAHGRVGDKGEARGRRASEPLLARRLQAASRLEIALGRRSESPISGGEKHECNRASGRLDAALMAGRRASLAHSEVESRSRPQNSVRLTGPRT
jgi:hypothetical protein